MKKLIILFSCIFILLNINAHEIDESLLPPKFSFGWNKGFGASAGYTKIYKEFDSNFYDIQPPSNIICADVMLYGVYFGIGYGTEETGYNVYGYSEELTTEIYKLGISFNLNNNYSNWRYTFTPYSGIMLYSLSDTSGNDIGARDEYETKESKFLIGCKISANYKGFNMGAHCSNREFGFTLGFEYDLYYIVSAFKLYCMRIYRV